MRSSFKFLVYSWTLSVFICPGVAFAVEGKVVEKEKPPEQCVRGGRLLRNVKTSLECINNGGAWVRIEPTTIQPNLPEKGKATKSSGSHERGKSISPAGQQAPSGGQ